MTTTILTKIQAVVDRLRPGRTVTLDIDIPAAGDHLVFLSDGIDAREFEEHVYAVALKKRFEELRQYSGELRGPSGNVFYRTRGSYPSTYREDVETRDAQDWEDQPYYERMKRLLTPLEKPVAVHVSKNVLYLNLNVANGTAPGSDRVRKEIAAEYIAGLNEVIEAIPDENIAWLSEREVDELQQRALESGRAFD